MSNTPRARRTPEETKIGRNPRLIATQSLASKATARQNTAIMPQRARVGNVRSIFFFEKEKATALEKDCSTSDQIMEVLYPLTLLFQAQFHLAFFSPSYP